MRKVGTVIPRLNPFNYSEEFLDTKNLKGSTACNKNLSCDSVMDGAFFPQLDV